MAMDLTSPLRSETFRPLMTLLVPGALALFPWATLVWIEADALREFAAAHGFLAGIALLLLTLAGGFVVENLGSRLEVSYCDAKLKEEDPDYDRVWSEYLGLAFENEPIGQRYLSTILTRLRFELHIAVALVVAAPGWILLILGSSTTSNAWVLGVLVATVATVSYLLLEARDSSRLLARTRKDLVDRFGGGGAAAPRGAGETRATPDRGHAGPGQELGESDPDPYPFDPSWGDDNKVYLGDVFSDFSDRGELRWDAAPVPGATVRMLVAVDGEHAFRQASVTLTPFLEGPYDKGVPIEVELLSFPDTWKTECRFIEFALPADIEPGWAWLRVRLDERDYDALRIEIAEPGLLDERDRAFAKAEAALREAGEVAPALLTGLYSPRPTAEVRDVVGVGEVVPGESGSAWVFFATRVDDHGAVVHSEDGTNNWMVAVDRESGAASVHGSYGLASWTLYNYPQRPARGGYAGWWWKRSGLPAGGTCGTAWCNYPFPGNGLTGLPNTIAIAQPPPDPMDWWRRRRDGWICGNGWFYGPNGPGGRHFGPWWPVDSGGRPRPGLDGPRPEPTDEPSTPPRPTTAVPPERPTPVFPPAARSCEASFVEAVSKYTYGRPSRGRRLRAAVVRGVDARYDRLPPHQVTITWTRVPSGWSRRGGYSYAWSVAEAHAELRRNRDWWARYCIDVADRGIRLNDNSTLQAFAEAYQAWLTELPVPPRPNVRMGYDTRVARRGANLLRDLLRIHARQVRGDRTLRGVQHVLFMPRVVGRTGHYEENRARLTEASFTVPGNNYVVINHLDADDPYVLAHELIHAWGRPKGLYTWTHESGDPRAMSRLVRRHINEPAGLDGGRLLDYAEYDEILQSGQLRPR